MSVLFVFLLMGELFESFVLPLSVIVSIPFSFLGVYWFLYLTDTPFEMMSMIGSVLCISQPDKCVQIPTRTQHGRQHAGGYLHSHGTRHVGLATVECTQVFPGRYTGIASIIQMPLCKTIVQLFLPEFLEFR